MSRGRKINKGTPEYNDIIVAIFREDDITKNQIRRITMVDDIITHIAQLKLRGNILGQTCYPSNGVKVDKIHNTVETRSTESVGRPQKQWLDEPTLAMTC